MKGRIYENQYRCRVFLIAAAELPTGAILTRWLCASAAPLRAKLPRWWCLPVKPREFPYKASAPPWDGIWYERIVPNVGLVVALQLRRFVELGRRTVVPTS
jgi:hypothetical protein